MGKFRDLTGTRFGRLEVLSITSKRDADKRIIYVARCDCGNVIEIAGRRMTSGTKSCGCLQKEALIKRNTTHGKRFTKEYLTWLDVKKRCCNPKNQAYPDYGGRGITICEGWRHDFEKFLDYVGEAPSAEYSLDRIDNSKGYEEGNVRWILNKLQARNKRISKSNKTGVMGVYLEKTTKGAPMSYTATWTNTEGKSRSKAYCISKYGEELALFAASEKRDIEIEKLRLQGEFYGEFHGQQR